MEALQNPFGPKIRVQYIERKSAANGEKLGTYGVIRGTDSFLGVTVKDGEFALEALGYDFEQLVLYAASIGLGTCWLGGTFNRSAFAAAMEIEEGELFPILSPIGYPADNKSLIERIMRGTTGADKRQDWSKLFFCGSFENPITQQQSCEYAFPLEMLRLAPSAVNVQPWRVVLKEDCVHFLKKHSAAPLGGMDMQRIDLGIAICHFHLAVQEMGIEGGFEYIEPDFAVPSDLKYVITWKRKTPEA